MPAVDDLAQQLTVLGTPERHHLERLLATWGLLADLSFSDLLLLVPVDEESLARAAADVFGSDELASLHFLVMGQMRPAGNQTLFQQDAVGRVIEAELFPLALEAWRTGTITTGDWPLGETEVPGRASCIPVLFEGDTVGVLVRVWSASGGRRRLTLERAYLPIFGRLARMVHAGTFPFVTEDEIVEDPPRVGDGVIVLDAEARVTFASPNAVNALHRIGVFRPIVGSTLAEAGIESSAVSTAMANALPAIEEVERRPETIVLIHCIPLLDGLDVVGAAVLVRDVTDLRRRDRLLLSKDAAIREVHHRVKNNLQTISSLLRLQSRRVGDPSARDALLEAEHRIRTIAAVHEILASEPGDQVHFAEIVPTLIQLAHESDMAERLITMRTVGEVGDLPGDVATPLALVVAELLQNSVEHGFRREDHVDPAIELSFARDDRGLTVVVHDNGVGFPDDFDIDLTRSLGLAIVRDLVQSQLGGVISVRNEGGAVVSLVIPLR
jgi:two-component system, sensor histidine kinase PdtaS